MKDIPMESRLREFLAQVESPEPILLHNAYDLEELAWMCSRLRTSERFGSDNRLYLSYSSREEFQRKRAEQDWTPVLDSGKTVVVFEEDGEARRMAEEAVHDPMPLEIGEIQELVSTLLRGCSGSDFFNMVLDGHPSLLTIGWHGMSTFTALYKVFCEGETSSRAIEHLKHPANENEQFLWDANMREALKYQYEKRVPKFFDALAALLDSSKIYGMADWFRAFFLAVNDAAGRTFRQRIAPAIFYDEHGGLWWWRVASDFGISLERQQELRVELRQAFPYRKFVGIVRAPLSTLGSAHNLQLPCGPTANQPDPLLWLRYFADGSPYGRYMDEDDPDWAESRQVRFEDLKLYPRETTEKLCEFLRIPWSETCLHITTNGEDGGIVDGTEGFDITPVYKMHPELLSVLDGYRIELLNVKNFDVWGYKLRYYQGQTYTKEELKMLFALPFQVEQQKIENWPGWPDPDVIREFHAWIFQRALEVMEQGEQIPPRDAQGRPKKLVRALFPEVAPGQQLYACGRMPVWGRTAPAAPKEKLDKTKRYIYGAGHFGYTLARHFLAEKTSFYGFIVSEGAPASTRLGLPVINVADFHDLEATVYIAIDSPAAVREVREHLHRAGLPSDRIVEAAHFVKTHLIPSASDGGK